MTVQVSIIFRAFNGFFPFRTIRSDQIELRVGAVEGAVADEDYQQDVVGTEPRPEPAHRAPSGQRITRNVCNMISRSRNGV